MNAKPGWDADGICNDHGRFACADCAIDPPMTTIKEGDELARLIERLRAWGSESDLGDEAADCIETLRAEMERRDRNENRNCLNWGPCSRHNEAMENADHSQHNGATQGDKVLIAAAAAKEAVLSFSHIADHNREGAADIVADAVLSAFNHPCSGLNRLCAALSTSSPSDGADQ